MNKNTHRLIFNASRGCMMAVAETVGSCSKSRSATSSARARSSKLRKTPFNSQFPSSNTPLAQAICAQAAPKCIVKGSAGLTGYNTYNSLLDKKGELDPNKAMDISINVSLGTSKSQSNTTAQADTAKGSSLTAGGNVNVTATGAGKESNLAVQGSSVTAGNSAALTADGQVNLLAAANTSSQASTNSNSSSSVGLSYSVMTQSIGFNASASKGQGKSDGQDTSYTNTQIAAGNIASIKSGADTNLKGAVITANTIKADVGQQFGGSLSIQSLQDTSSYTSKQSSSGGSISVGGGAVTGGSISASKSNINSTFQSVNQQSGLKAGDGGFQVTVAGNTALTGGVITSTDAAVNANKNTFTTASLITTDLQNTASYNGQATGISIDVGKQDGKFGTTGVGIGAGSDKGNASSTTSAGISGIAGNTAVRTGDKDTGLQKIFDQTKVQKKIDAEVQITQAFSKQAPKAAATFLDNQIKAIKVQLEDTTLSPAKRAELQQDIKDRSEGGIVRVLVQTVVGALGGGAGGAIGAATSAKAAPLLTEFQDSIAQKLEESGMSPSAAKLVASGITGLTIAGVGAAVGGVQGATYGAAVDFNNRQLHPTERQLAAQIAVNSKGRYTVEQIEEAMRTSGIKGSTVVADSMAVITNPAATDPAAPGARFDNGMPLLPNTGMVLIEKVGAPSAELVAYVQQATGGNNSPYYWNAQTTNASTTSNVPPDTGGPRYFNCATADCLVAGANRNPNNLQNQAESQKAKDALLAAGVIVGVPIAAAYGAPVLFGMGVTAQTVPLAGLAELSASKWIATAAFGGTLGVTLNLATDPNASPASLLISGMAGAVGGSVKLAANAGAGLASQWVPTSIPNLVTQGLGTSVGKVVNISTTELAVPQSGTSWWTTPVVNCGLVPRKPC